MLSLTKRSCRIGSSINTRTEKHGEDNVTALDIPLHAIILNAEELNMVLQEPHAHQLLFASSPGNGKLAEPVFGTIKALRLKDRIDAASVTLDLAGETILKLSPCNLARVEISPQVGGLTELSVQVQCTPKLDSTIARLLEKLDTDAEVTIRADGYGDQQKLPLGVPTSESDKLREGVKRSIAQHGKRSRAKAGRVRAH